MQNGRAASVRSTLLCEQASPCRHASQPATLFGLLQVGAVIVSPTRELARQIFEVAQPYIATVPWLRAMLLVGGT